MCLRYAFTVTEANRLMDRFALDFVPASLSPRYNIAPTQEVPVVMADSPERLSLARWGIPSGWGGSKHPLFNARSESVAQKPSFREGFTSRRCLMLSDAFYEWKQPEKRPFRIRLRSAEPFAFAAIYHEQDGNRSCCMITCPANELVGSIHGRMPVILAPGHERGYLSSGADEALKALRPLPSEMLEAVELTSRINSSRSDSPDVALPKGQGGLSRFMDP